MTYEEKINEGVQFLLEQFQGIQPDMAIVLGSGLSSFSESIEVIQRYPFYRIPHMKAGYVDGHAQEFILGKYQGKILLLMNGRTHYYEGFTMEDVTYGIRLFQGLSIKNLLLTNAAGGITGGEGQLMLIEDHLSFFTESSLRGPNLDAFGQRFPDATNIYTKKFRDQIKVLAEKKKIPLSVGVYAYMKGPMYETPAEIRALKLLGADCVGMSTVPEAMVGAHGGMNIIGISCITNMAAGLNKAPLSHEEVIQVGKRTSHTFSELIKGIIEEVI